MNPIVIALAGGLLAIIGTLIVLNLRSIKHCIRSFSERMNKQDIQIEKAQTDVKGLDKDIRDCKVDCERAFISADQFLRETGYARRSLEKMNASVNRLEGKLTVVEKLPQICGDISREIVKEMKNGESQ